MEVSAVAKKMTPARRQALRDEAEKWNDLSDDAFAQLFDEGKAVDQELHQAETSGSSRSRTASAAKRRASRMSSASRSG